MQQSFIKKYWDEEDIWFYLHFENGKAVRRIEVNSKGKVFLTLENPQQDESMLYDQSLANLDLKPSDFITKTYLE